MAKIKEGTLIRGNVNGASFLIVVQSTPNFSPSLIVTAKTKEIVHHSLSHYLLNHPQARGKKASLRLSIYNKMHQLGNLILTSFNKFT